jgi:hypothetical protein
MIPNPPGINDRYHSEKKKKNWKKILEEERLKKGGKENKEENGSVIFKPPGMIHFQVAADTECA